METDDRWISQDLTLPITTRGIGYNLCLYYSRSVYDIRSKCVLPNIHSVYRALLGIVEEKFSRNFIFPVRNHKLTYPYSRSWSGDYCLYLPKPLHSIVDAIGVIKYNHVRYYPAMSINTVIDGKFVPRPENILLSNLRDTVVALSDTNDSEAALLYRKSFHRYNSIPAARWDLTNYTILNPDEIIPAGYDSVSFCRDLEALITLRLIQRSDKDFHLVDLRKPDGKLASLMSNEMNVRTSDLKTENLSNYNNLVEFGDTRNDSYYSLIPMQKYHARLGATLLLGEQPVKDTCPHHSFYLLRSEDLSPFFYPSINSYRFLHQ